MDDDAGLVCMLPVLTIHFLEKAWMGGLEFSWS